MADDQRRTRPGLSRRRLVLGGIAIAGPLAAVGPAVAATSGSRRAAGRGLPAANDDAKGAASAIVEADSTFFSTASLTYHSEVATDSGGDLWPAAWSTDGALYTSNGDGRGFSDEPWADIVANRIDGMPPNGLTGVRLAAGDQVGRVWSDPAQYNRKPTGMVAIDGDGDGVDELYLAVQDLKSGTNAFDDAPAASIAKSTDGGVTWTNTESAMFSDHVFTTIFFLDYGKGSEHRTVLGPADSEYVYAYGLDYNWRTSFSDTVPDPVDVYLARVPIDAIQDRASWRFFSGTNNAGEPTWNADIEARVAVLHDERRLYPSISSNPKNGPTNLTVLAQGGVVYNAPLERYLYTSWTEYTFEFYEAPRPWGPWKLFLQKDFGPYPWWGDGGDQGPKHGGYATTVPSKFISDDGRTMWVQSNWFVGVGSGANTYNYSMRQLRLTPHEDTTPSNPGDSENNLARTVEDTVAIDRTSHYGHLAYINDGVTDVSEDSWNGTAKQSDWWGYTWPRRYRFDRVVYTTGQMFGDGGWFGSDLRVQVRQDFGWVDVENVQVSPEYPHSDAAGNFTSYTFTFDTMQGDGIRIVGVPGGGESFTSIAELEVYFDG